jgi:hypothetical protein
MFGVFSAGIPMIDRPISVRAPKKSHIFNHMQINQATVNQTNRTAVALAEEKLHMTTIIVRARETFVRLLSGPAKS